MRLFIGIKQIKQTIKGLSFSLFAAFTLVYGGCSEDKVPEPSSSGSSADAEGSYFGFGAEAGSPDILKRLAECNKQGYFFNRLAQKGLGECDKDAKVTKFKCRSFEEVQKGIDLTSVQETTIEDLLAGDFKGFEFDQCLDVSKDPEYNGFKVYLVKEDKEGNIEVSYFLIANKS